MDVIEQVPGFDPRPATVHVASSYAGLQAWIAGLK